MMEKILEKLDALDEDSRILAAIRAKKNSLQFEQRKRPLTTPLLLDLHVELGDTTAPITSKPVAEITEDKSHGLKKSKMHASFKYKSAPRSDLEESDLPNLASNINYEETIKKQDLESSFSVEHQQSLKAQEICLQPAPASVLSREPYREPKGENLKSGPTSLRYLKNKPEAEYSKPLNFPQSQHRNRCKRSSESSILDPTLTSQPNAFTDRNEKRAKKSMYSTDHSADSIKKRRKHHPLTNYSMTKENESTQENRARTPRPMKQSVLLPLNFEDVLNNPTVKIIDLVPTQTVLHPMDSKTVPTIKDRPDTKPIPSLNLDFLAFKAEESHANPVIFHDTAYIEMLLLIKRFTPYVMAYTRKNVVLEKNCKMIKALFNDKPSTAPEYQRTKHAVQHKDLHIFSVERVQKSIKEKRKKKHDSLVAEQRPPNTLYNLSRTFSSLTKKFVGYFDKVATQEKSAKIDEFEKLFSKEKPPPARKFTALPLKYNSKPLKNILEIRKLNNITPLDNLLSWKVNDS